MKNKINFIIDWIKIFYPIIIVSLFLLDYTLFVKFFEFDEGLFFSLFLNFNLISFSIIILFIILPFVFIGLFIYSSVFAYEVSAPNKFSEKKKFLKINSINKYDNKSTIKCDDIFSSINKYLSKYLINLNTVYFFFLIMAASLLLLLSFIFFKSTFLFFIVFLVLNSLVLIIINRITGEVDEPKVFHFTFLALIIMVISLKVKQYFDDYAACLLFFSLFWIISYSIMYVYSEFKKETKKINIFIKIGLFLFFILMSSFFINNSNEVTWKKEISTINPTSVNLSFNKVFLVKNSVDTKVIIPSRYYQKEIENIKKDKNSLLRILNDDMNGNINYEYIMTNDYYYLELSSSLKIYFKNIFNKKKHLGYRIFIIDEKKFPNKVGSEYILLGLTEKIFK